MKSFASDNLSGVHPAIFKKLQEVNIEHSMPYGGDPHTARAEALFREHFGPRCAVYFVVNGTAANVLGLKAITQSYHAILCADTAHLNVDECGAPENGLGCKLQTVKAENGKITPKMLKHFLDAKGDQHHVQPKVISISQTTELGTVYSLEEIKSLADFAHTNDLYLHVDGARLANAAVSLNVSFKEMTADLGVDILSFGGTKNGLMYGEAVVFFDEALARGFKYIRKQGMQLISKMRFLSAQFEAYFNEDLWKHNAAQANAMAKLLAEKIAKIPQIRLARPVEANAVFAVIPKELIEPLQKEYFFYVWDAAKSEVRWMTSFDTTSDDIDQFVRAIGKVCEKT